MHNSKPHRKGSRTHINSAPPPIDLNNYPFIQYPPDALVQPGDTVQYMDEDEQLLTGTVLAEGSFLSQNVIYVCVRFSETEEIESVAAELLTRIFDYEALDAETRIVVQQKTGEIKGLMRQTAQGMFDIGTKLIEVKAKLGHGNFGKWLAAEFEWSERTAQGLMRVANEFKSANFADLKIGPSALALLAAPSTPETVRDEMLNRAQNGEPINYSTVKNAVVESKGEPPQQPAPQPSAPVASTTQQRPPVVPAPQPTAPVRYTKVEDDYQDDVPSVRVDDDDPSEVSIAQARADLEQIPDSPAKDRLTAIVNKQQAEAEDRAQRKANWLEHERLRNLAAQTPPPEGKYRTLVIDPPWPMKKIERGVRPNQGEFLDYPTMHLPAIYNLGIEKLAADDGCHLYLWTTHKFLPEAIKIVGRWGFRYNCLMTWVKTTGMTPYHFRFNTELVIFATRGSMAVQRKGLPLAFEGESLGHSRKPDTFYNMVMQASPGPRLDMFARCERDGFAAWGNEVRHASAAAD